MARERLVTRTVIDSKKYKVYKMEGTTLVELEEIETKGKVSEKELATKHEVDKVVIVPVSEKKVTYGMTVSEFMKYAVVIEDETAQEPTAETENK